MKKFTCQEMGGTCEAVMEGETAEEVSQKGQAHVDEMAAQGDESHKALKEGMDAQGEEGKAKWMEEFKAKFDQKADA
ncbi:MAG: DUF1059 domain-containing protein [Candidatus Paceibacterota bacterium]